VKSTVNNPNLINRSSLHTPERSWTRGSFPDRWRIGTTGPAC